MKMFDGRVLLLNYSNFIHSIVLSASDRRNTRLAKKVMRVG